MRTHNRELFRLLRSLYLHLLGISIQCQAALQLSIVIATLLASIGYFYPRSGSIAAQYRHLDCTCIHWGNPMRYTAALQPSIVIPGIFVHFSLP